MKRQRGSEDVSLTVALTDRLAAYARTDGIHCRGCGTWVADDDTEVPNWGYDHRGGAGETGPYPYCDRCARLGVAAR